MSGVTPSNYQLTSMRTADVPPRLLSAAWRLAARAFAGDFGDDDWRNALGGWHVLALANGALVSHAAVVERCLHVAGRPIRTGYVEAVATEPEYQGRRVGTAVLEVVGDLIREHYDLGALSTGRSTFYARCGWEPWRGPSSVRRPGGNEPTPDDDGGLMVLRTDRTVTIDVAAPISCDDRPGDCW